MIHADTAVATKSDIQLLIKRFDRIDQKLEQHDKKFEEHDEQFELMHQKFEEHDQQFELMHQKFEEHDQQFELMHQKFVEHDRQFLNFGFLAKSIEDHFQALTDRLDRYEEQWNARLFESESDTKQIYIWPMSRRIQDHEKRIQDLEKSS